MTETLTLSPPILLIKYFWGRILAATLRLFLAKAGEHPNVVSRNARHMKNTGLFFGILAIFKGFPPAERKIIWPGGVNPNCEKRA